MALSLPFQSLMLKIHNKGCEDAAIITKWSPFPKCLFSSDVSVAVADVRLKLPTDVDVLGNTPFLDLKIMFSRGDLYLNLAIKYRIMFDL